TARKLLAQRPDSQPILYILAEAAEKQNLEETISWREQIARLRPKDPDSQLNLISAALRFGKLDLARKTLDQIAASDRHRAAFHVGARSEEHTSELHSRFDLVCRLLLGKKTLKAHSGR